MFYRESGDFKTTYAADQQTFPLKVDRWEMRAVLALVFLIFRPQGLFGEKIIERV